MAGRAVTELRGIPQVGSLLGNQGAPRLTIFARVTSPGYRRFDRTLLPALITRYVRPGRLRVQLRTLPDEAARLVQAAGLQTRLWQLVRAAAVSAAGSAAQVRRAAALVPGLDRRRLVADSRSDRVGRAIARAARMAARAGARRTPAFRLEPGGRTPALQRALRRLGLRLGGRP